MSDHVEVPALFPKDRLIDFDIFNDPGLRYDIFKRLEEVKRGVPRIGFSPKSGGWLVFGREEIRQVLMDGRSFSTAPSDGGIGAIPLTVDPPHNVRWRRLLQRHFGPVRVRALEPFVRQCAEREISKLDGASSCDFVKAVAEPMPVTIFMIMMGLPLDRFDTFRSWVVSVLSPPHDDTGGRIRDNADRQIKASLEETIEQRRHEPKDDLISDLLAEQIDGREVTAPEMMSICYLLILAGLDTVTNAMAFGMRHLARHADLQQELRRERSLIPAAVEMFLRRYTFVVPTRRVKQDVEVDGMMLRAGQRVMCVLWSGSDDAVGDSDDKGHMAFGAGHHLCLGMHLARLQLCAMFETWFDHIANVSLAPDDRPAMRGGQVMSISRLLLDIEPLAALRGGSVA